MTERVLRSGMPGTPGYSERPWFVATAKDHRGWPVWAERPCPVEAEAAVREYLDGRLMVAATVKENK